MPQNANNKNALNWLRQQSRSARKWLVLTIVLGFFAGVLIVAQAWFIAQILQAVFKTEPPPGQLSQLFMGLITTVVFKAVVLWAREVSGFRAGAAVRSQIRNDLMAHIAAAGPVGISAIAAGQLVSSALEQVEALQNFIARYLPQLALAALLPVVILFFVFPISWAAGSLLLITAPLIPVFMILVGMGAEAVSQRHFQALAYMSAHFLDILRGMTTLKLFGRSKNQATQIESISRQYRQRTMAVLRVAFLSSAVLEFFSAIAIALVAVYLGMSYLGYLDFGAYGQPLNFAAGFFILLLAPDFFLPLRELGTHYHARADAVGAAEEILKVYNLPAVETFRGKIVSSPPATIQFRSVSVNYGPKALRGIQDVNITLQRGEHVAVVGESGAGKSTLIHLLLGFVTPTNGQILIDHTPLNKIDLDSWRCQVAWIGQAPMLFSGSLRENISLAKPSAPDAQIRNAAQRAGVMAFAEKRKKGLLYKIGEQGKGLSMGQAQRVALARAFLKDAPLLLLDEPTASLDTTTEKQILTDLQPWSRGRTVLMATHRPAALTWVDRIIVLKAGCIVAQGSYTELTANCPELLPRLVSDG